jgi:hypothetical protein
MLTAEVLNFISILAEWLDRDQNAVLRLEFISGLVPRELPMMIFSLHLPTYLLDGIAALFATLIDFHIVS